MDRLHGRPLRAGTYALLAVWALFTVFPIYWTVVTSFKSQRIYNQPTPRFLPFVDYEPTLQSWQTIITGGTGYERGTMGNLGALVRTSLTAAIGSAVIALVLGAMAAYGLSRFRYRRWKNNDIAFWIISQRMLPPIALVVPYFILFNRLQMIDNVWTLVLVYTAANLPLVVWLLRDYFADLPIELEEASMVDGTSRYGAFVRIVLPLALPGLVIAFLFAFVFAWNEFLIGLGLTFDHAKTLPVQIAGNVGVRGARYWDIAAQGLVVMVPPLIVAALAGRYIVRGLTLGAVKH